MKKERVRLLLDPLDEVIQVRDLDTNWCYGGLAYVETLRGVEVLLLFVDEDWRGLGLGTKLLEFLFESFPDKDVILAVINTNHDAQRFYARLGFEFLRGLRTGDACFLIRKALV